MRPELLDKIKKIHQITTLNLMDMKICDNEISEIMNCVKRLNPNISQLDFDKNFLSDKGALILSEKLGNFNDIRLLSLQYNNIGENGALSLMGLKKKFPNLNILFHGNSIINVREMKEIEDSIGQCKKIF